MKCHPPTEEPDETLIKSIAARDEVAMRELYQRHNGRVFRFVARILKDKHFAEDITSEVFFEVWRQAGTFRSSFAGRDLAPGDCSI